VRRRLAVLGLIVAAGLAVAARDSLPDLRYIAATFTQPCTFTGSGESITVTRINATAGATGTTNQYNQFAIVGPLGALTDAWAAMGTEVALTTNDLRWELPAGTIVSLFAYAATGPDSGSSETVTITVQDDGVDTAMAVTLSGSGPVGGSNASDQFAWTPGHRISIHVAQSAVTAATANLTATVRERL
jgi:hypothetical protein